uniref:Uncharacterized protein n=1 Tax=Solanum tuberosum TaxID=4113 RepID=M1DNX0_SOLTU
MTSSSKSPEETEILTSSDTSLVIVRKESPPDDIWVSVDGIARIMLINDSRSLPADEEVHFQDLPLVEFISTLAARKRTRSSACHPLQIPTIVLSDDDLVSCRDRRGKHITSKPS